MQLGSNSFAFAAPRGRMLKRRNFMLALYCDDLSRIRDPG